MLEIAEQSHRRYSVGLAVGHCTSDPYYRWQSLAAVFALAGKRAGTAEDLQVP